MKSRPALDFADGVMLAVVVIWGANNVIVKSVLDEVSPLAYVFGRFLIVVLLLLAWLGLRDRLRLPDRRDWPLFVVTGISGFALYNVLFTVGLDQTSAFSVALLISLGPVFTLLFASVLGIERSRGGQWLGAGIAALGVVVFVAEKVTSGVPAIGDGLSLVAAASFAVYSLATRPLVDRYGSTTTTFWAALIALVAVTPLSLPAVAAQDWVGLTPNAWGSLLYASALSMLLAYTLWAWAIARGGVGRTVPYLFLVPIVSGLLAAIWLDERFGLIKLAGAALVLVGTAFVRLASMPPAAQTAVPRKERSRTGASATAERGAYGVRDPADRDRSDRSRRNQPVRR